jgi:hypothetical protein
MIGPDFQCTWWPDTWFGVSLSDCCIAHDLGGGDIALMQCVADKGPAFAVIGLVMLVGVTFGRPIYRAYMRLNRTNKD